MLNYSTITKHLISLILMATIQTSTNKCTTTDMVSIIIMAIMGTTNTLGHQVLPLLSFGTQADSQGLWSSWSSHSLSWSSYTLRSVRKMIRETSQTRASRSQKHRLIWIDINSQKRKSTIFWFANFNNKINNTQSVL